MTKRSFLFLFISLSSSATQIADEVWTTEDLSSSGFTQTPAQGEGPFYPQFFPKNPDTDLTQVEGKTARGIQVLVQGHIAHVSGSPIEGALVEIWQACQNGSYNHPGDSNPAPRDPNFQYYGRTLTDKNGSYSFRTIIPGPYPASDQWMRPSHIHFKISHKQHRPFITQLYFDGHSFKDQVISTVGGQDVTGHALNKLNELDLMLRQTPKHNRHALIVPFYETAESDIPVGTFNLYLENNF